ncbi:MAG TPA: hypothetical protein VGC74_12810, partial [Stenotrophomonas sp.]
MRKEKVLALPLSSSLIMSGPALLVAEGNARLSMEFDDDGNDRSFAINFLKQRAMRKTSELYCTAWHVKDTYDTLCEILDSD